MAQVSSRDSKLRRNMRPVSQERWSEPRFTKSFGCPRKNWKSSTRRLLVRSKSSSHSDKRLTAVRPYALRAWVLLQRRQRQLMRRFSLLPLACYGALIAYACYAWFQIGHWPYYAHPDPKELPHRELLSIMTAVFLVGVGSVILVPVGYPVWRGVMTWRKKPAAPHRRPVLWYLA